MKRVGIGIVWAALLALAVACGSDDGGSAGGGDTMEPSDTQTGEAAGSDGWNWDDNGEASAGGDTDPVGDADADQAGTPDSTGSDGTTDTGGTDTVNPGGGFFPSHEMTLRILGPGVGATASVLGNITSVGGVVFGQVDSIAWTNFTNGASGNGEGAPFWKTGPVQLAPGDNHVKVVATRGDDTAEDSITITYNPGFRWDGALAARPPALFAGDNFQVVATVGMSFYTNFNPATVKLLQVDAQGQTVKELATMRDDGGANTDSNSGDEYPSDGVFTAKFTLNEAAATTLYLRVSAQVTAGASVYTAYGEILPFPILQRLIKSDCDTMLQLTTTAHAQFEQALQATGDAAAARDQVVASLQGNAAVLEAGPSSANGSGAWMRFANGVLGGLSFPGPGTRGGADEDEVEFESIQAGLGGAILGSKRAALLSPFAPDFPGSDESAEFAAHMSEANCPPLAVEGGSVQSGAAASLKRFSQLYGAGIAAIVTHGDALFQGLSAPARAGFGWPSDESREVLWTGEAPVCANLQDKLKTCSISQGGNPETACPTGQYCLATNNAGNTVSGICYDSAQVDLMRGRLVFGRTYGVLPEYIDAHADTPYPNSMIYLGACRSLFNGTLASAFFAQGAKTVFGYTGTVSSAFAYERGKALAEGLLVDQQDTGGAFEAGQHDPTCPATSFEMFGASTLDVNNAEIVNPSFEMGTLTGWTPAGDGRVISKLGATGPVAGKFMGVMSTGMGYTLEVGSMSQKFCLPADANTVQFYWNYFSEEFPEFCGTEYQDPFTARLKSPGGSVTMVDVTVDSLCPSSECYNCGSDYVGIYKSDVNFDQGDAWYIRWQKSKINISALTAQQKPVELQFFVTDEGDSIYDTVILVDDVKFLTE